MYNNTTHTLLTMHLQVSVPLLIIAFASGDRELNFNRPDLAQTLAEHGDAILYRIPGKTAPAVNALSEALATMAFVPGGVRFLDLHFEATEDQKAQVSQRERKEKRELLLDTAKRKEAAWKKAQKQEKVRYDND